MGRADLDRLADSGIIAVLRGVDPDAAGDVARALRAGGVDAVEVTVETPGALAALSDVAAVDGVIAGAGTVRDPGTVGDVVRAGAEFVVSPHLDPEIVATARRHGALVAPGAMTPTEVDSAVAAGADAVKVFPASTVGPGHVRRLRAALPDVPLVPTGGVDLDTAGAFVDAGAAAVGVGSALVDRDAVDAGEFDVVEETASAFVNEVERARE